MVLLTDITKERSMTLREMIAQVVHEALEDRYDTNNPNNQNDNDFHVSRSIANRVLPMNDTPITNPRLLAYISVV